MEQTLDRSLQQTLAAVAVAESGSSRMAVPPAAGKAHVLRRGSRCAQAPHAERAIRSRLKKLSVRDCMAFLLEAGKVIVLLSGPSRQGAQQSREKTPTRQGSHGISPFGIGLDSFEGCFFQSLYLSCSLSRLRLRREWLNACAAMV